MKTGMTRVCAFLMSAVLLIGMTGCSGKKKKEEMKNLAEGVVENYLVFLSTGKYDKLSRYCDPKDDQFQDIIGLENSGETGTGNASENKNTYPPREYLPYWKAYLSHLKFSFGEFDLDGTKGSLDVDLDIIDGKKALRSSIKPSEEDVLRYLTEADTYVTKKVTLNLNFDTDENTCKIKNAQVLFKEVKKQFDIVLDTLPKKHPELEQDLRDFMDKIIKMDTEYLSDEAFYLAFDPNRYNTTAMPLYREMACIYTYDFSFIDSGDDWAIFKLNVTKKDEERALDRLTESPANWALSYEKLLSYAIDAPQGYNGQEDLWPLSPMLPVFREYLELESDKIVTVEGEIRKDPHTTHGYRVAADFEYVFPALLENSYQFRTSDPDFLDEVYREAMQNLLDKRSISQEDHKRLQRLVEFDLNGARFSDIMEKHGFTLTSTNPDGINNYSKDDRIVIQVTKHYTADETLTTALSNYTLLESMIAGGTYTGELSGGLLSFEHRGQLTDNGTTTEVYSHFAAFKDHILNIYITNCTDADIEEARAILQEYGLD